MKTLTALALIAGILYASNAVAAIKWVNGYNRSDGSYTQGAYRDTSNDGNPYNNANYYGYND